MLHYDNVKLFYLVDMIAVMKYKAFVKTFEFQACMYGGFIV